ncbi:MAG: hypothetical protein QOE53_3312 [Pseudonocardiales bacterium]|nr:hypothetical protein [Pseudonocardiales bacterium]
MADLPRLSRLRKGDTYPRNDEAPARGGGFCRIESAGGPYLIFRALQTPAWSEDQRPLAYSDVNPLLESVIFELLVIT